MAYVFLGVDHVQLAAPEGCEEQARSFFGELLGWPEIPKPAALLSRGGVWFRCGAQQVHVGVQRDFVPATKAHPAFEVRGLDRLRAYLEERGAATQPDDHWEADGARRFYARDPFGNRLEFLERGEDER